VEGEAHFFRLSIRDNGVGFDEDRVRKGNGIKNLYRRAAEMNSKLQILSQAGRGTTISLEVGIAWMVENAEGTK
jgi:two-component system, NarL family, sensor kinase